jgi:hypothetical protein
LEHLTYFLPHKYSYKNLLYIIKYSEPHSYVGSYILL